MHKRVTVIGGGRSSEHEVSLASAAAISSALKRLGYEVDELIIDRDGRWVDSVGRNIPSLCMVEMVRTSDVVFPALHGVHGEDGEIAALCEILGRPYVGSPLKASALGMDKWVSKLLASEIGLEVADATLLTKEMNGAQVAWVRDTVVKPVSAGSSSGVSRARDQDELDAAMAEAFDHDDRVLLEEYVAGREVDVGILERPDGSFHIAPPLEILHDGIFDRASKYDGSARFVVPAALTDNETVAIQIAAREYFRAIGARGVARIDFFVRPNGTNGFNGSIADASRRIVFNEINTMPGMTEHSQLPRMMAADGISYDELIDTMVQTAIDEGGRRYER